MANGNGTSTSVPSVTPPPPEEKDESGWMGDVQRAIALILIGSFSIITMLATFVSIFLPDATALNDMAKTLQAALVNMSLIALGFFFGSNMSKLRADAGQQRIMEKLTGPAPPGGPVALVPSPVAPVVVVSWWSLMDPAEQTAIRDAAKTDPKIKALLAAFESGKAEDPDLAALVAAGLLTQARADTIKGKGA